MNAGHQDAARLDAHLLASDLVRRVGEEDVPTVSVSASSKDGGVLISASNLDLTEPVELTLDLRGGRLTDPAGLVLTADRVETFNDADRPDAVEPQPFDVTTTGDVLRVTLPPHSFVTVSGTSA
jgi:alpha-N-arabinofuranosidase